MNEKFHEAGQLRLTQSGYEEYTQRRSRELGDLLETALRDSIPSGYRITTTGPHKVSNAILRLHPTNTATGMMDVHFYFGCSYKPVAGTAEIVITRESGWLSLGRMGPTAWTTADEYLQEGRKDIPIAIGAPLEHCVGLLLDAVASCPSFVAIVPRKLSVNELLATKFYPVDGERRIIVNQPLDRERVVAWAWRGCPFIGHKGSHLKMHRVYDAFTIVDATDHTLLPDVAENADGRKLPQSAEELVMEATRWPNAGPGEAPGSVSPPRPTPSNPLACLSPADTRMVLNALEFYVEEEMGDHNTQKLIRQVTDYVSTSQPGC